MTLYREASSRPGPRVLHGTGAAREARSLLRQVLASEPPEAVEVAVLLTSELVTNAVLHADGDPVLEVELSAERDRLRVTVADDGRTLPVLRRPSSESGSGRGIALIDHFANRWGIVRSDENAKSVWFELHLPTPIR